MLDIFDVFGGALDTFLFFFVAILVAVLTRIFNKSGSKNGSKQSLRGQIRSAVERATAVPPPMTSGQYVAPNQSGWPPQQQQRVRPSVADLNAQVMELMAANREVAAIRLLCDEADLGIIEAQQYARELSGQSSEPPPVAATPAAQVEESTYVGSAAFATSIFETGEDEGWASGWTDTPEPEDRGDIDELWRTVRSGGQQTGDGT